MKAIRPCSTCSAPLTLKMTKCPHCDAANPPSRLVRLATAVATLTGGFTISSTLAACYGTPCADGGTSCMGGEIPASDAAFLAKDAGSAGADAASSAKDAAVTSSDATSAASDALCVAPDDGGDKDGGGTCDAQVDAR